MRSLRVCAALLLISVVAGDARAQCRRPTDPQGINGYAYGADTPAYFDGQKIRIWYTTTGPHAVDPTSSRMDKVPDNVVTAATVGDAALAGYAGLGFRPPLPDGSCGGDARLDIYLMHFNAADGDAASQGCTNAPSGAMQCTSFGLVEARLESIYGSFELGAHIVLAHEIFHSVQDAYDAGLDRFWAEGTAQWAAKTLYPMEMDLEANLPAFFADATRSIDVSPGGVTNAYLYGAAIWPVFLDEHVGASSIREALEAEAQQGPPSMDAIDAALKGHAHSLADTYPVFAAWNAGTGTRAGTGGYKDAKSYPQLKTLAALDRSGASDVLTGYSIAFYQFDFGADPQSITIDADPSRVGAETFPLENGAARLDKLAPLPQVVSGPGVLVVAGVTSRKSDAPFTIHVAAPMPDAGVGDDAAAAMASNGGGGGGCSLGHDARHSSTAPIGLLLYSLVFIRRRRGH